MGTLWGVPPPAAACRVRRGTPLLWHLHCWAAPGVARTLLLLLAVVGLVLSLLLLGAPGPPLAFRGLHHLVHRLPLGCKVHHHQHQQHYQHLLLQHQALVLALL